MIERMKETTALLFARAALLKEGASPHNIVLTPSDLKRFGLEWFDGTAFGMRCVDSPILVVKR